MAVLVWFASRNYLVPLVSGATIIGFGRLASRATENQAWALIPSRRRDLQRPLPASWQLGSGLAMATVLWGTALMLAAGVGVGIWKHLQYRRQPANSNETRSVVGGAP